MKKQKKNETQNFYLNIFVLTIIIYLLFIIYIF